MWGHDRHDFDSLIKHAFQLGLNFIVSFVKPITLITQEKGGGERVSVAITVLKCSKRTIAFNE